MEHKDKAPDDNMWSSMSGKTKHTILRAAVTLAVFAVIYIFSEPLIGWRMYDAHLRAIEFLAAVIGAGCYWIGSSGR